MAMENVAYNPLYVVFDMLKDSPKGLPLTISNIKTLSKLFEMGGIPQKDPKEVISLLQVFCQSYNLLEITFNKQDSTHYLREINGD